MRSSRTAGVCAALAASAAAFAVATAPAGAVISVPELPGDALKNPLTTNVPILAWNGAEAKVVTCSPLIKPFSGQQVEFRVQKFSGTNGGSGVGSVQKMANTERIFSSTGLLGLGGQGCAKANFDSLEPGIAIIHMTVTQDIPEIGGPLATSSKRKVKAKASTNLPIVEQDFIVGWMKMNAPSLDEVSSTEPTGASGPNSYADFANGAPYGAAGGGDGQPKDDYQGPDEDTLGDPLGDGQFFAGENNGRMTSTVTGSIPVRAGFFDENDLGSSVSMPADWKKMAGAMATDQDNKISRAAAAQRWDIHDDQSLNNIHVPGTPGLNANAPGCNTSAANATVDAVENCRVGNSIGLGANNGLFSRVKAPGVAAPLSQDLFGLVGPLGIGNLSIGPFDPVLPDGSLLSNGELNSHDAPMPPARIKYEIVEDSDSIGSLEEASKADAYSRDGEAGYLTQEPKGNLYAPFYVQTPTVKTREVVSLATGGALPGIEASGIDSALFTSNFPGLGSLPGVGADNPLAQFVYPNWSFASVEEEAVGGNNGCNSRNGAQYQLPEGAQVVSVLSDEHGESQAEFAPGTGFVKPSAAIENSNGGCDLQGINTLGTSTIRATSMYPYHDSLDNGNKQSTTITKTVNSLFDKSLSYWSKGAGAENSVARIVIAHAQDVDGSALTDETVCFMADHNTEGMRIFRGWTGKDNKTFVNGPSVSDPAAGLHRVCGLTDANGNVALELFNSNGTKTNVIAEYYDEGLLRHIFVDFAKASEGQSPPPNEGPGQPGGEQPNNGQPVPPVQPQAPGAPGTKAPSNSQLQVAGVEVSAARPGATAKAKYTVSGRIVRPLRGRAYLRIKATGAAGKVAVRVRLVNKRGKTVRTAVVRVQANRVVKVKSLKITRTVKTVRLSVG